MRSIERFIRSTVGAPPALGMRLSVVDAPAISLQNSASPETAIEETVLAVRSKSIPDERHAPLAASGAAASVAPSTALAPSSAARTSASEAAASPALSLDTAPSLAASDDDAGLQHEVRSVRVSSEEE
jgi:hypothetical protein